MTNGVSVVLAFHKGGPVSLQNQTRRSFISLQTWMCGIGTLSRKSPLLALMWMIRVCYGWALGNWGEVSGRQTNYRSLALFPKSRAVLYNFLQLVWIGSTGILRYTFSSGSNIFPSELKGSQIYCFALGQVPAEQTLHYSTLEKSHPTQQVSPF